jgi:hypothetical protein
MKITIAIIALLAVVSGSAYAENAPTPKPEDAERNAFQTPTTGKDGPKSVGSEAAKSSTNPEDPSNKAKPEPPKDTH